MIRELDRTALGRPFEVPKPEVGGIGIVVLVHDNGRGFEVEFVALDSGTYAAAGLGGDFDFRLAPIAITRKPTASTETFAKYLAQ